MEQKGKLIYIFYPILAYVLWGTLFVVTKYTSGTLSIPALAFFRSLIAAIALYFILLKKHGPLVHVEPKDRKYFFAVGVLGYFLNTVFNMAGVKYAGATLSSFITVINPFTISLLAALILKERLTFKKILCICLAMGGVMITTGTYTYNDGMVLGVILILCSVISWSFASVYMRLLSSKYDPLTITFYGMVISLFFHTPSFIIDQVFFSDLVINLPMVLSVIYMGVFGTAFTMLLWNKSLAVFEASTCSLFFPIQAFVSAFLSALLLGETVNAVYFVGFAICTLSIVLNFFFSTKQKNVHA